MSFVESIFPTQLKLSSIDEAKLLRNRASIRDSLELSHGVARQLNAQLHELQVVEAVGTVLILTSFVSDIILDTAGDTVGKRFAAVQPIISCIYVKAREWHAKAKDKQWKNSRYEKEIERIKTNVGYLEKFAQMDRTGMWKMAITVQKNMLINVIGLQGYAEDSRDARMQVRNAMNDLLRNIAMLEKKQREIDFYLSTGKGAGPQPRFTPAVPGLM